MTKDEIPIKILLFAPNITFEEENALDELVKYLNDNPGSFATRKGVRYYIYLEKPFFVCNRNECAVGPNLNEEKQRLDNYLTHHSPDIIVWLISDDLGAELKRGYYLIVYMLERVLRSQPQADLPQLALFYRELNLRLATAEIEHLRRIQALLKFAGKFKTEKRLALIDYENRDELVMRGRRIIGQSVIQVKQTKNWEIADSD